MRFFYLLILFLSALNLKTLASLIIFNTRNATVWSPQQIISGSTVDFNTAEIIIHINDSSFTTRVEDHQFSFTVMLREMKNVITAEAKNDNEIVHSDTLEYSLGFKPLPVVKPFATKNKNIISLRAEVIYNPYNRHLSYQWKDDVKNLVRVRINHVDNNTATVNFPAAKGIYYFHLLVSDGKNSASYQTFVIKTDSIHCFNIITDHAAWLDSAVVYEISPHTFVKNGNYNNITEKLPELRKLGVNTIWLQPVFKTQRGGQGYDVTDYFSLRADFGDEKQLQQLIYTAKKLNMKVLFDFVPNHTSISHPYAVDCIKFGKASHYYNFYQRANDGAKYSSLYKTDTLGFVHYFWKDLVNLDYNNPEVRRWMIEACKYWLNKFDIDGYRLDAVWAVNARNASFGKQLQTELKSIKPDFLLLAEDKGSDTAVYQKGFDAAYDWTTDTEWISHWSWQYEYHSKNDLTIFNYPDSNQRGNMLRKALFYNGDSLHLRLRFIENNDLPRFIKTHDLHRTKMVAALEFALPGIPLIYNGQEIGSLAHPYSSSPVFSSDSTIQSLDKDSLFEYYQHLIELRKKHKGLYKGHICNLEISPSGALVAFHRWFNDEHFIVAVNMDENVQHATIFFEKEGIKREKAKYVLTDMFTNETFPVVSNSVSLNMDKYTTRILLLKRSK